MKTILLAAFLFLSLGCRPDKDPVGLNQCLRPNLFKLCMEMTDKLSIEVESTAARGIIEACGEQARQQALLRKSAVKPEDCWVP